MTKVSVSSLFIGMKKFLIKNFVLLGGFLTAKFLHFCRFVIGQYVTVHGDVISHVNISHVMVEDGGEYTCTAENRAGKTSHSARLNIYGKWWIALDSFSH